ncbi:hypothetical protein V5799_014482 [Amblyomma americanum]|uniref:Uncharacterized protein n=1 Tax=Amblyomma americanum TaxID=6943 RepID=A0AAQ4E2X0_AMBAM
MRPHRYISKSNFEDDGQRKSPRKDHQFYPAPPSDFPSSTLSDCIALAKPMLTAPETTAHGATQDHGEDMADLLIPQQAYATPNQGQSTAAPAIPEREFQRQVMRQLQVIRLIVEQNRDTLENMLGSRKEEEAALTLVCQPFDDLQEWRVFDNTIPDVKDQLL